MASAPKPNQASLGHDLFIILRFAWRFFTGDFLDGKARNNSTWSRAATHPKHRLGTWRGWSRRRRAAHRNVFFWLAVLTAWAYHYYPEQSLWFSVGVSFTVSKWVLRTLRDTFTTRLTISHNWGESSYRSLKIKYRRMIEKVTRIGQLPPVEDRLPPEVERNLLAENAEDYGEPIISARPVMSERKRRQKK